MSSTALPCLRPVLTFHTSHLANVAGIVGRRFGQDPLTEQDDADWDLVMGVNVYGK